MRKQMKSKEVFETLLSRFSDYSDSYHIKIDTSNHAPIFMGVSSRKRPVFIIDVPYAHSRLYKNLNETAVYSIYKRKTTNDCFRLEIEATSENSFEVFFVVLDDLIQVASKEESTPILAVINRLLMWEDFFKNTTNGILTHELQIGLFGELLFIEEQLEKGNHSIISQWKGPLKEVKDFIIENTAIEVKTSVLTATNRIRISDENQLDSSGFSELFLNVRLLIQDQMDGRSIPELIMSINNLLDGDPLLISEFEEKLMHIGYIESMCEKYERKYEPSDSIWYKVEDKNNLLFPRIVPSDLNNGVKFVQYQIELSTMAPFTIDSLSVDKSLKKDFI